MWSVGIRLLIGLPSKLTLRRKIKPATLRRVSSSQRKGPDQGAELALAHARTRISTRDCLNTLNREVVSQPFIWQPFTRRTKYMRKGRHTRKEEIRLWTASSECGKWETCRGRRNGPAISTRR